MGLPQGSIPRKTVPRAEQAKAMDFSVLFEFGVSASFNDSLCRGWGWRVTMIFVIALLLSFSIKTPHVVALSPNRVTVNTLSCFTATTMTSAP